jgi:hypothetical protein
MPDDMADEPASVVIRRGALVGPLAIAGVALPYIIAVLGTVLFRESIRNVDFYASGQLDKLDNVTGWLTFLAFVLGSALCWPWWSTRLAIAHSRIRWVSLGVAAVIVQFVLVFVVRFVVYYTFGGIL